MVDHPIMIFFTHGSGDQGAWDIFTSKKGTSGLLDIESTKDRGVTKKRLPDVSGWVTV